jgi:peptidoglycan hydrolase-like protein with peptidoglycan-binding domain
MRKLVYLAVVAAFLVFDWSAGAAVPAKKKAPARKTSVTRKKSSARKTSSRRRSTSKRRTATWRNRQMTPTPERYKEIQQALAAKGYLSADEANGTWGSSSVEALKRFQAEQNIEASGKINSLSLIALGLGPKREPVPPQIAPPAEPRPEPSRDR